MLGVLAATLFLSLIGRGEGGPDKALSNALGMSRWHNASAHEFLVVFRIGQEFVESLFVTQQKEGDLPFDSSKLRAQALPYFEEIAFSDIDGYINHDVLGIHESHFGGERAVWVGMLLRMRIIEEDPILVAQCEVASQMPEETFYWEGFEFEIVRGQGPDYFVDFTPTPEEAIAMEGRALLGIPEPLEEEEALRRDHALIWQNLSKGSDNV